MLKRRLVDDVFSLPIADVAYLVRDADGAALAMGVTDHGGEVHLTASPLMGLVTLVFHDPTGRLLASAAIDPRLTASDITVDGVAWRALAAAGPPVPPPRAQLPRYRRLATVITTQAAGLGLRSDDLVQRGMRAALLQDRLSGALASALQGDAHTIEPLLKMATAAPAVSVVRDPLVLGPTRGARVGGEVARDVPTFGPGVGAVFEQLLHLGQTHPALGRRLLGLLLATARTTAPLVRALRTGRVRPEQGGGWTDPHDLGGGWPDPGGDPDFGALVPGDPTTRCAAALVDAYDGAVAATAARGGGARARLTIAAITPDHEVQIGDRRVHIDALSPDPALSADGAVPVSFPTRTGRVEVIGTVIAVTPAGGEWLHRIEVAPPVRTSEGVVQVLGVPLECQAHTPIDDPALTAALGAVGDCTGVDRTTGALPAAAVLKGCTVLPINWRGSVPALHFRWTMDGVGGDGDLRRCVGGAVGLNRSTADPIQPRIGRAHNLPFARLGEWAVVYGGDHARDGCQLLHESVLLHVEADRAVQIECLTTNAPTVPTALAYSPPIAPSQVGPAAHVIDDTAYHVAWTALPNSAWHDLGVFTAPDAWAAIEIPLSALGRVLEPTVQLVRASASNHHVGFGRRVIEIVRHVEPARISALRVVPRDGRAVTADDPELGPEETIAVEVDLAMPTYAALGVRCTVEVTLAGVVVGATTVVRHSREPLTLTVATVDLREVTHEGPLEIAAAVRYAFTSAGNFPEGVALGERAGTGASARVIVLPRIVVLAFLGQWNSAYLASGEIDGSAWAVELMRTVRAGLVDGRGRATRVSLLEVTGRVGQDLEAFSPDGQGNALIGTGIDLFVQTGELRRSRDGNDVGRGGIQLYAAEWGYVEGSNEWGQPLRQSPEDAGQIDRYMQASELGRFVDGVMGSGRRRTHFVFAGHSRGGGAGHDIMSWIERTRPAEQWSFRGLVWFDAMYTDGFFQPVIGVPACAGRMLHLFALRASTPPLPDLPQRRFNEIKNREWTAAEQTNCPGATFEQHGIDANHGGVPRAPGVQRQALALVMASIRDALASAGL